MAAFIFYYAIAPILFDPDYIRIIRKINQSGIFRKRKLYLSLHYHRERPLLAFYTMSDSINPFQLKLLKKKFQWSSLMKFQ